jgi:hypothetical protein
MNGGFFPIRQFVMGCRQRLQGRLVYFFKQTLPAAGKLFEGSTVQQLQQFSDFPVEVLKTKEGMFTVDGKTKLYQKWQ